MKQLQNEGGTGLEVGSTMVRCSPKTSVTGDPRSTSEWCHGEQGVLSATSAEVAAFLEAEATT